MKQLRQLWGNHKGLPLQIIAKRRGNPLWLPKLFHAHSLMLYSLVENH